MRPSPKPHHLTAALILVSVAAVYGYLATLDTALGDDQLESATVVQKLHDPSLYSCDRVFGPSGLWRLRAGAFERMVETLHELTDERPIWTLRMLTGVISGIYLLSMYALLVAQTRSWSVSVLVSVLSSATIEAVGGAFWGAGPLWTASPMGLAVAVTPLAAWALVRPGALRPALAAAVVVLFTAQLHLGWSANLALVLSLACLVDRRGRSGYWRALILLAAMAVGVVVSLWLRRCGQSLSEPGDLSARQAMRAFELAGVSLLYPRLLDELVRWGLVAAGLAVPSAIILLRIERYRARDVRFWLAMGGGALAAGLALSAAAQGMGMLTRRPWFVGFPMALAMAFLPLWVLLGQSLTVLFRIFRAWRVLIGWLLAVVTVLWLLPSDNVRVIRHQAYALASSFMDEQDKPRRLAQIEDRRLREAELDAIARWGRRHADPQAVFVSDDARLRLYCGRAVVAAPPDVQMVFYLTPGRLEQWSADLERIGRLLRPPGDTADPQAIRLFVAELATRPPFDRASQWYVVVPVSVQMPQSGTLEMIQGDGWGSHLRLYRVH